ncbi:indolepyruvate ferredoxin oxidoreductase family protein [Sandaracinobacter sp. RS1-74]|uniref:indolepyruvate ferredoxin oxidoreductase family protein n=1 Tax=Sandaracinobacteroides sayramensis TaxID=2913411 RepID=UPI001EDC336E|nr:indolepyruvate ferredoxin oxidoreductase family protein [Sandaracinobacteroides sayramensis]MCG2839910.1 indolepyruvate ferredoxin oxidoreductase family protein [Sandaracinobacteroides sayramensis]
MSSTTITAPARPASLPVSLDDRYDIGAGRIFLSGTQALVRLALVQQARDAAAGLKTGGFISGYRGSPLGGFDQELWRAKKRLSAADVLFVPGINEELGATAVWGSQMTALNPSAKFDGVFGLWYGKGPGLDRAMDVLKHANAAGTSQHGGVLAIVGDDHGAKSSTLPHQSDHNFSAAFVPFLAPSSVHEFVEYGLLGIAMSRFAGTWVGFKATADTVETSATVDTANERRQIILPPFDFPEGGVHIRPNDIWRDEDTRLQRYKGFAAQAFAKANGIDQLVWDTPRPRFGILSTGKAFADTMEALEELGIDARVAADIGLRLYKVGMPWPLEPDGVRAFAEGLEEVLVIEEKREFIEHQLKWQLYNWKPGVRPKVVGKQDETGEWLLSPDNELTPGMIAKVIAKRLSHFHKTDRIENALAFFEKREALLAKFVTPTKRSPYFCSGCPHNTSTKVPEGGRALAGIGCHIMALWMDRAQTFTQMGGEGVTWVGEAPFVGENHVFANLGDGTYEHSGLLAIRQSIASGTNITYKILFNDAVAMTGGQPVEGQLTVGKVARQMLGEGAQKVWVLTEDMSRYPQGYLPAEAELHDRGQLEPISKAAAATPGCTVIIYDQTCAAEKRRRRKRGLLPDPDRRVIINPAVCEGCGDCSVQSNCVSVEPLQTEFGRKRRINQSSCNKDYSCLKGFCPSFITVDGVEVRKPAKKALDLSGLPDPQVPALTQATNILVTGIGGTGVLTVSALLGMAGHLAGVASTTADMAGLAQKGGAVWSHVRLAPDNEDLLGPRIMTGGADLVLACDSVVAADKAAQNLMSLSRTHVVANADIAPTADFVRNRDLDFKSAQVKRAVEQASRAQDFVAAERIATALMGDAIAANVMLMGYAWQKGLIPLSLDALHGAIELNGISVDFNKQAFALGRLVAHDPARVEGQLAPPAAESATLDVRIASRVADLTAWGDAAYAARFRALVERVRAAETALRPGSEALTEGVARALHKLMAYKDEYEVARLMTDGRFDTLMADTFSKARKRTYHLSPPIFARTDPATGRPKKYAMPGWAVEPLFRLLASMKGLRGTAFDLFGRSEERRHEREAIPAYEAEVEKLLAGLTGANLPLAVEIARLPLDVRGYGPVKEAAAKAVEAQRQALWAKWPGEAARAAA